MSAHIGITHLAFFLPERIDDVRSWGKRTGQDASTVRRLEAAGVQYFRHANGRSAITLAANAIESLIRASRVTPDTIDCLLYVHTLQGSVAPPPHSLPNMLCEEFGFLRAEAFSLAQQHCASALSALRVIRAMCQARSNMQRVLLVGADAMPLDAERLMPAQGLLGDGAFAALIERDAPTNRLMALVTHASGLGWQGMRVSEEARVASQNFLVARHLIRQAVTQAHYTTGDIVQIFPHHLDLPTWRRLLASLGLPDSRLFARNFARLAHVTVSDAFINLAECGALNPGSAFLLYAQGVGGFSAAALFLR